MKNNGKIENKIGLEKNTVELVPYNTAWESLFNATKKELETLIGNYIIDIQHIGSTAIINIEEAKPIIDVAVLVEDFKNLNLIKFILEEKGYDFRGDPIGIGGRLFLKNSTPNIITHHLHFIKKGDPQWGNFLSFRDKLNQDSKLRGTYSNLKRRLKRVYDNRKDYTKAKNTFISEVLEDISNQ